tara:strand:+ start:1326 stop:1910 length:585 start_codon:yes stop_codon:yes gene_type:complete
MTMKIQKEKNKFIIEEALPLQQFKALTDMFLVNDFPWFFGEVVRSEDTDPKNKNYNFHFSHTFHNFSQVATDTEKWNIIKYAVVDFLNPLSFIRIKSNLLLRTSTPIVHGFHVDTICPSCLTAIIYLNDNNGFTLFEDGTKIQSKANRMAIFPSFLKHSGSTCTDITRRIVLNINYIPFANDRFAEVLNKKEKI